MKNKKKSSKKSFYKTDPHYLRESAKYEDPLPSRELILQVLEDYGRPMSKTRLVGKLELETRKQEAFGFRLRAMVRDGQIMQDRRGRFCLLERINLITGTVQGHPDGYGFLIPEDGSPDILLSAVEMRSVMHGDIVLGYKTGVDRRGRLEGKIHEVIQHTNTNVVGRFSLEHGMGFVMPDSKRLTRDISIPAEYMNGAKNGQIVLAEIISYPTARTQAIGKIVHILGEHMAPGMEIEIAILSHGLPSTWSNLVQDEVASVPMNVRQEDLIGRKDLRDLDFVTIDGEDAKDFDDAIYCLSKPKGGFILYVAIADVSHYVKIGSALDETAAKRGNSVYFPGQVVPMLPEALSNGICSLNPKVDRLCMVAEISINANGSVNNYTFYRGVIHSRARLTYTKVYKWIENKFNKKPREVSAEVWNMLQNTYLLYKQLINKRNLRGALDFDSVENKIIFDKNRKIKCIKPLIRNEAHRLIEECMLVANVSAAQFLEKAKIPALYRVHDAPDEEKLVALRQFLKEFGLHLKGDDHPTPKDFQKTLVNIGNRPEKNIIEMVMLRSLKQAQYIESNAGHFGLAYTAYTHFTSPIRRYPDLLIHRAIGHILDNKPVEKFSYQIDIMSRLGKQCSLTERRADEATRDVVAWLKCEYMQDKLGQVFYGCISSVTGFGLFVSLDEIWVEGLVHVTSLKTDYYIFDPIRHRLVGERSGKVYRIGDRMQVQVARVNLDDRKIDFVLIDEQIDKIEQI